MKKIIALVLALAMVAVLGLAFAAPTDTTITIPSTDNHTYSVYQIYTGELAEGVLSNVHYGKNAKNGAEGVLVPKAELDAVAAITGTDAQKAAALEAYANLGGKPAFEVDNTKAITVPTGYYLIKDKNAAALSANDEATLYILQVVGPTSITRKAGTTTSDKTTDDINDSTGDTESAVADSDYDIGDAVPYHLKATLTEKIAQYDEKYHVTFEDTLEKGRFSAISALTIKVDGVDISDSTKVATFNADDTKDYTISVTEVKAPIINDPNAAGYADTTDGFKIKVEFTPKTGKTLASLAGKNVTIDFTATLGAGAQIGGDGNTNTLKVVYSNNPNDDQEGTTTEHKVTTFTFKVVVNKVDGNNKPLDKAGFTLYKITKDDAEAGVPTANAGDAASKNAYWATKAIATKVIAAEDGKTQFSFDGLDDGYYVLCETTTPAGYNTIDPELFKIEAVHDNLELTSLTGTKLDGSTITFDADKGAGSLTASIQNNQGTVLPSTGGIGTTIFYILGGLLVVGAAVILVARRKAQD